MRIITLNLNGLRAGYATGFLPEERAWLTRVFEEHGFVDVFRMLDPSTDRFTWWNPFGGARERNIGWRIGYQIATPGVAKLARKAAIYTGAVFSDHAPVIVDYDYDLANRDADRCFESAG